MSRRDKEGSQVFCLSSWKGGAVTHRDGETTGGGSFCGVGEGALKSSHVRHVKFKTPIAGIQVELLNRQLDI